MVLLTAYQFVDQTTASSTGPVLGGVLAERASWRWIFWFLTILSGVCLFLILVFTPRDRSEYCRQRQHLPN